MFNSSMFKYLIDEESSCQNNAEKLSIEIRKYLENKAKRKLSSDELMIMSHYDLLCQSALKELSEKYNYKNKISDMIDFAADQIEKQISLNKNIVIKN